MKKPTAPDAAELRRKAEQRAKRLNKEASVPPSHVDTLRLVHELQVHQIELEMQNEELKKAREDAEQERQRYADLYDFAPVGYLSFNADGTICQANLTVSRLLGVDRSRLLNRRFDDFIAANDRQAFQAFVGHAFVENSMYSCEVSIPRQGQAPLYWHVEGRGNENDKECRAAVLDITRSKRMEEELLQARKMEAIGRLAGGVAHDLRNQLTVIKGFTELLLSMSMVKGEGLDMLRQILNAAGRAELTTGQLLSFSRKDMLRPEEFDLAEQVGDICKSLPHIIGPDVRLKVVPSRAACIVRLDPGQLSQALCNLASNARYAMGKGGELRIETRLAAAADDDVAHRHPDVKSEAFAILEVADNGLGMDAETVGKLFEPFFTTKPVGDGTGLGLAMVYGFVKQSGGAVEVESLPGQGTTFRLYFPLAG